MAQGLAMATVNTGSCLGSFPNIAADGWPQLGNWGEMASSCEFCGPPFVLSERVIGYYHVTDDTFSCFPLLLPLPDNRFLATYNFVLQPLLEVVALFLKK